MKMEQKKRATITRVDGKFVVEYFGASINTYAKIGIALQHLRLYFEEPGISDEAYARYFNDRERENKRRKLPVDKSLKERIDPQE